MFRFSFGTLLLVISLAAGAASGDPGAAWEDRVIPSWGDYVCAYGPGTDPAMDTPEAFENMVRHWKGRGYTGVYLRTDLVQLDPSMIRRNPVIQPNPRLAALWKYIDDVMESFDVFACGPELCRRHGFQYWAWHPHLYSDGAPENVGSPGPGRMTPWSYCSTYTYQHPDVLTIDRAGNRLWMVREYAYPGARASKVAEFVHMARNYGIKRFVACMRSEVSQLQDPPDKADRFGFNEPVVQDMKRLYSVDILTDPRFDVDKPAFNPLDPMVENWRNLRGQYVTQLFRELRRALNEVDPHIRIAVTLSGDHVGPPLGNWRLDWRTWVDEGLIDEIITPVFFEATLDHEAHRKGYLTDVRAGKGTVSFSTLREYIERSKHPQVKVISSGAYPYFSSPPPPGTDGWRSDVWYDSYHLAWRQRWRQWEKDLEDLGRIRFLEQDFDAVVLPPSGRLEAWGVPSYCPKLRSCPGCWYKLGDGRDERPVIQGAVRRGAAGRAVRLTRGVRGDCTFTAWHNSGPDRSMPTAHVDNAIANGKCAFEFWLFRDSPASSLAAYLQSDGSERDVGLRVAGGTGRVSCADRGEWVESDYCMPVGRWRKFRISVDLDNAAYSAQAGQQSRIVLCRDIHYESPRPGTWSKAA